jgi:VanZ family protein
MIRKNKFSLAIALVIMYLSLASSETFDSVPFLNIHYLDKIIHFLMYFGLMLAILYENKNSVNRTRQLLITATIPFLYGILMEILQFAFTDTRSGSILDIISNSAGILAAALLWLLFVRMGKNIFR